MERPKNPPPPVPSNVVALAKDELGRVSVVAQARTPAETEALVAALAAEELSKAEQARELAWHARAMFQNGYGDRDAAMLALVAAFHGLRRYVTHGAPERPDGRPPLWDAQHFHAWAKRGLSSGALDAARFILGQWNSKTKWSIGRFDLHHALSNWDAEHRGAFLGWAEAPWWP